MCLFRPKVLPHIPADERKLLHIAFVTRASVAVSTFCSRPTPTKFSRNPQLFIRIEDQYTVILYRPLHPVYWFLTPFPPLLCLPLGQTKPHLSPVQTRSAMP